MLEKTIVTEKVAPPSLMGNAGDNEFDNELDDEFDLELPDVENLVTEDDTPVDNLFSAKQQRLLGTSIYSSFKEEIFLADANIGIFFQADLPPIVPDFFLSLNVKIPDNWKEKKNRSYFVWEFGKPPELVVEIVSNKVGKELTSKLSIYEKMRVSYYIVYDPLRELGNKALYIYKINGASFVEISETWFEEVNLGVTLWEGEFEKKHDTWLRWCDKYSNLLLTGDESKIIARLEAEAAKQETQIAKQETQIARQEAEAARQEAETANQRAETAEQQNEIMRQQNEKLLERLRALGIDPNIE